jgi:carboxypeptidase C (cathepsin A)
VARYAGLPVDLVRRAEGRLSREVFLREVLRDEGRVVGRYDASVTTPDPDPGAPYFSEADPSSQHFTAPLLTAMNAYLETELKVTDTRPYVLFSRTANEQWNWRGGRGGNAIGAAAALRSGMIASPALRVLIVHGRFDMVTPYFASKYLVNQLHADPALRRNVTARLYDGGHMMYFHRSEREQLWHDAAAFYAEALHKRAD